MQVDTLSHGVLDSAVGEMNAVISCHDKLGASAPGIGSRAAVGDDLSSITRARLQVRGWMSQDGPVKKKMRQMDSVALSLIGYNGLVTNSLHRAESFDSPETRPMTMTNLRSPRMKVTSKFLPELFSHLSHLSILN